MEPMALFLQLKFAVLGMLRENGMVKNEETIDRLFIAEQLTADLVMDEAGFNIPDIPFDMTLAVLYLLCDVAQKEIREARRIREMEIGGNNNEGRVNKKYSWGC